MDRQQKYTIRALKNVFENNGFKTALSTISFSAAFVGVVHGSIRIIRYDSVEDFMAAAKGYGIGTILFQENFGVISYPYFVKEGFIHQFNPKLVQIEKR